MKLQNQARKVDRMVTNVIAGKYIGARARRKNRRNALLMASIKYVTDS
jgi:hypothetical protein